MCTGLRRQRVEKTRAIGMSTNSWRSTKENLISFTLTYEDARQLCGLMFQAIASTAAGAEKQLAEAEKQIERLETARRLDKLLNVKLGVRHDEHGYGTLLEVTEKTCRIQFEDSEQTVDTLTVLDCSYDY